MSYADKKPGRDRLVAIGSVALIHAGIGYALISGLAYTAYTTFVDPIDTYNVPVPIVPPPVEEKIVAAPAPARPLSAPDRIVDVAPVNPVVAVVTDTPPLTAYPVDIGPVTPPVPPVTVTPTPAPMSLSAGVSPRGNQGDWFPQDSYPAAARREGAEGRVSVTVGIGVNGRVTDCRVVSSSGNADLDGATCRLATRNGRFTPARDADGQPVASSFTLRNVRWQLEN
ncbi:hypothetical protein ASE75_07680 [Sphingomonas sp. Leaf17]|uniref:energy transducer TonB n=1 Tax=Sphingomonas sp. Leaf17 TaxID=1735683 RepID=UPI0006FA74CC|nr:energy transducer TonB [Sphingomonas sp. Leaf17]KQM64940.1 hypothetical protein ASE75_07680 [Sphingomonas sp. Leaf17]